MNHREREQYVVQRSFDCISSHSAQKRQMIINLPKYKVQ